MTTDDAELLAELRRMWEVRDPAPAGLADDVLLRLAPELDDDAELLALLDDVDLTGAVRSTRTGSRTFAGPGVDLLIRVAVLPGGRRRIDGWVAPASAGSVLVAVGGLRTSVPVAATGRFEIPDLPPGDAVVDLAVRAADGIRRLRTPPFPI